MKFKYFTIDVHFPPLLFSQFILLLLVPLFFWFKEYSMTLKGNESKEAKCSHFNIGHFPFISHLSSIQWESTIPTFRFPTFPTHSIIYPFVYRIFILSLLFLLLCCHRRVSATLIFKTLIAYSSLGLVPFSFFLVG